MGVYSQNRTKSLVAESVVNEHDAIVKSIEECEVDPRFCNLMETVIQLHENDKKVFDAMIECDFISVTNEAVMLEDEAATANGEANETKKVKLKEKIEQIFDAVAEAIKKFVANAIVKITDLVKSDVKICDAYRGVLHASNLEGFEGIKDFAFPNLKIITKDGLETKEDAYANNAKLIDALAKVETKEAVDSAYEEFTFKIREVEEGMEKFHEKFFLAKEESFIPTDEQLKLSLEQVASAKDIINGIKTTGAQVIKELKELKNKNKQDVKFAKKNDWNELDTYIVNKKYSAASTTCKVYQKKMNLYFNVASKQIAAFRKVVILCGRYAAKHVKGDKKEETGLTVVQNSAIMAVIGESSDLYVAECLGY